MKTEKDIKKDLKDITFYSMREKSLTFINSIQKQKVKGKVDFYNKLINSAPFELYLLYVDVYIKHEKLVNVASSWNKSIGYIAGLNKKLIQYFKNELNKEDDDYGNYCS